MTTPKATPEQQIERLREQEPTIGPDKRPETPMERDLLPQPTTDTWWDSVISRLEALEAWQELHEPGVKKEGRRT